jgi:uncharacterized protein YbaP (TraB family)
MGSLLLFLSIFLAEAHKPHLYKIQPPQQNAPCSYILGGAHVASTKQLPPIVFSLIENTSQYFVETDAVLAHIDQMTYQPVTNIKKFTPGLKTVITPEAFAEVKKYFSIYSGITDEVLNDISPEDIVLFFQVTQLFAFYHAKNEFFDLDLARFASQKNKSKDQNSAYSLRLSLNSDFPCYWPEDHVALKLFSFFFFIRVFV